MHVDEPDDEDEPAAIWSRLHDHAMPRMRVIDGN